MSYNTRMKTRKHKMTEPYGDNNCQVPEEVKPSDAKNRCVSSGPASGDNSQKTSSTSSRHNYVAILSDLEKEEKDLLIHSQCCDMGDVWSNKYPILQKYYPKKPIHTGNAAFDSFLPELLNIGYNPIQLLTKGKSGAIILAQDLTQGQFSQQSMEFKLPVAIKLFSGRKKRSKNMSAEESIKQEISIHRSLSHSNIVTMINHISSEDRFGLVLEFCYSGNMDQLLRTRNARFVTEPIARRYFKQIFSAVEYLHLCGICHRDICTYNIVLTNDNIPKLADFGCAIKYMAGDPFCTDLCGTLGFQAPEMICRTPYNPKAADIFSLGCVLYYMVVGRLPYDKVRTAEMARKLKSVEFPKRQILFLSNEIKELLRGLLCYIPESRYSLNMIKHCDWSREDTQNVQIGNFYLVRQPQKIYEGKRERELKDSYDI